MIERARSGVSDLEFEHRMCGALYIADDWHGRIWRVTHRGSYARNLIRIDLLSQRRVSAAEKRPTQARVLHFFFPFAFL
jgi:hypothetical protein